jgi:class 3 adenylate cyclase
MSLPTDGALPAVLLGAALLGAMLLAGALLLALRARLKVRRLERLLREASGNLEQLQLQFSRFAPADVVERLTESDDSLAPHRREVTVLIADLRGFTALCDRLDPAVVLTLLNGYFAQMSEAISRHHGRVHELVGDGLLALFGALEPNPWQARDAVLGGLEMRAALAEYNGQLAARGLPTLRIGIGIHKGELLVGVLGFEELLKFGVVGDAINVASRVEGLTRVHEVDLLITEEVRGALDARFRLRCLPAVQVKGKSAPIVTYHVEGMEQSARLGATAG